MERNEINAILSKILEINVDESKYDTELESLENWDSLACISVIAQLALHQFPPVRAEVLSQFKTVGELAALFQK